VASSRLIAVLALAGLMVASIGAFGRNAKSISAHDLVGLTDLGVPMRPSELPISPDGRWVAVQSRQGNPEANTIELRWKIVPVNGAGSIIDAGDGGDLLYHRTGSGLIVGPAFAELAQWSPDSKWIVYRASIGGEVQLWKSSWDGKVQEKLTHNGADVIAFHVEKTGVVHYVTGRRSRLEVAASWKAEEARGFLYDDRFVSVGGARRPASDAGHAADQLVTWSVPVGGGLEKRGSLDPSAVLALSSGLTRLLDGETVRASRLGEMLAWASDTRKDRDVGFYPPETVTMSSNSGKDRIVCQDERCTGSIRGIWISRNGDIVFLRAGSRDDPTELAIYRWNFRANRVSAVFVTNDLLFGCAYEMESLICGRETPTRPTSIVSIALTDGSLTTVFDPNPSIHDREFGIVRALHWRDAEGRAGFGHLVLPTDYVPGTRYPLIIVQYRSRGFLRGGTGDEYPIHLFAANGFAVLSFDEPEDWELLATARSADELEKTAWSENRYRRLVHSVLMSGIEKLIDEGIVDEKRVGITGLSDGANTGVYALIHAPHRFAAASLSYTHWNPSLYFSSNTASQRLLDIRGLEEPTNQQALGRWRQVSIAMNANNLCSPLLVQVSDAEFFPEVQTYTALAKARKPFELYVFPDEHQVKTQPAHRLSIYLRNLQWFGFWLKGQESDDPLDEGQYSRWRKLRSMVSAADASTKCDH